MVFIGKCKQCWKDYEATKWRKLCDNCRKDKYVCPICWWYKRADQSKCKKCKVYVNCAFCWKKFLKSWMAKTCSKECAAKYRKLRKGNYMSDRYYEWKTCLTCWCVLKKWSEYWRCPECAYKRKHCPICWKRKKVDAKHCKQCIANSHTYTCTKCWKECVWMHNTTYCNDCFPRCLVCWNKVWTVTGWCCSISCATKLKWQTEWTKQKLQEHLIKLLAWKYWTKWISHNEKRWADWFDEQWINYETQFRLWHYYYDFKIWNFLIEIDPTITHNSSRWYREWSEPKDKKYHQNKSLFAEQEWYHVIHLFDWDFTQKVKDWLVWLLTKRKRLYTKEIAMISAKEAYDFYEHNHLQWWVGASLHYALMKDDEIINVMSFTKRKWEWFLERFASKRWHYVAHWAEKLFKRFLSEHDPKSVISYSDITKHTGWLYSALWFDLDYIIEPSYWRVDDIGIDWRPFRRRACQKQYMHKLPYFNRRYKYLENKWDPYWRQTEKQIMEWQWYFKVYDAWMRRHVWHKKSS